MSGNRPRLVVAVAGLVIGLAWVVFASTRESSDDRLELAQQVQTRIDGAVVSGWTLRESSCPEFPATDAGARINCTAIASNPSGDERTANVGVRIAQCHGNVLSNLTSQDPTRDCSYDFTYTIHPGGS